jgi:beta-lactam-binding protein with PASTA domain
MAVTSRSLDSPRRASHSAWTVRVPAAWKDVVVVLVAVLLALGTGCGGGDSRAGTVPALVGLEQSEAIAQVQDAGLKLEIQHRSSDAPPGIVVKQTPSPGTGVDEDTTVVLVVSQGEP